MQIADICNCPMLIVIAVIYMTVVLTAIIYAYMEQLGYVLAS